MRELGKAGREAGAKAWKGREKSRKGLRKRGKSRHMYKKTKISEYPSINQEKLRIIYQNSVAQYISLSAGKFSIQRLMACHCAVS